MGDQTLSRNFAFLAKHDRRLALVATHAERSFHRDPVACIMRLRILGESLAEEAAAHAGLYLNEREDQAKRIQRLHDARILPREVKNLFHSLRMAGNEAVHEGQGDAGSALHHLKRARVLAVWFHQTFGSEPNFKPGPFIPPLPPEDASAALQEQLDALKLRLAESEEAEEAARLQTEEARRAALSAAERAKEEEAENEALEDLLDEAAKRESDMVARLKAMQLKAEAAPASENKALVQRAEQAGQHMDIDEEETRALIDEQLRAAGWEAHTHEITWGSGVRPEKGRNLAIAEWPTDNGPADYVLFIGLQAVAVVEAKRKRRDVASAIEQPKRYSRGYLPRAGDGLPAGAPWGDYQIPFLFASNGRPFLRQLATKSGIWFLDARREDNHARPLDDWYTPAGLRELLKVDIDNAHAKLKSESTEYLGLRDYQVRAIKAVEQALENGQQEMLLAMATGVGKTRTCIGLCYRLIKAKRFRRILFLVDRTSLGIQAAEAFKDARLENLRTFAEAYDMKELADKVPESDTRLQIATVQGMVKRVLYPSDEEPVPVDRYDCVVIDECHRGYLLDREMSDRELTFRNEADYISKYRRVLEHFDAAKVGLTATPAQHTTEIFGPPVFQYSYREAVIDGYLIDHEPPTRIVTALAQGGIHFAKGEQVETYHPLTGEAQLAELPDEVDLEVEQFNKRVVNDNFNRVVCEELAQHIDPHLEGKTLVFCATDAHADTVVDLLKKAFDKVYGGVDDDAVLKITGTSDRPLELIRRFKNERLPNVAVTVDLLTTGIDVPPICNIVFLRRVRSRILYEQMLGRATRRCDEIGKEVFRVFDAVDLYSALAPLTEMKPLVVNPKVTFSQLMDELAGADSDEDRSEVVDQFIAKLQRKKRKLDEDALERFEAAADMAPDDLIRFLSENGPAVAHSWFVDRVAVAQLLDSVRGAGPDPIYISPHEDEVIEVAEGFGDNNPPGDYLESFRAYVETHINRVPALAIVTQRPRDLTRKQLKELKLTLDNAGYSETRLRTAWRIQTNEDIAASIIGHIRRAALGDPLVPYGERVRAALKRIIASQPWKPPQRKWLERIGKQLIQETVVDRDAIDRGQFAADGGFSRLNKIFDGKLEEVLGDMNAAIWEERG